jgi:hypothetical protein
MNISLAEKIIADFSNYVIFTDSTTILQPAELVSKILYFIKNFGPNGSIKEYNITKKHNNLPWIYIDVAGIPKGTKKLLVHLKPFSFVPGRMSIDNKVAEDLFFYTNLDKFTLGCFLLKIAFTAEPERFIFSGVFAATQKAVENIM